MLLTSHEKSIGLFYVPVSDYLMIGGWENGMKSSETMNLHSTQVFFQNFRNPSIYESVDFIADFQQSHVL